MVLMGILFRGVSYSRVVLVVKNYILIFNNSGLVFNLVALDLLCFDISEGKTVCFMF